MSRQPPLSVIPEYELEVHRENGEVVFESIEEIWELDNGYRFNLGSNSGIIQKTAKLIARERLCCPFFEFTLTISSNQRPIWLKLTGRAGVQAYIKNLSFPSWRYQ